MAAPPSPPLVAPPTIANSFGSSFLMLAPWGLEIQFRDKVLAVEKPRSMGCNSFANC